MISYLAFNAKDIVHCLISRQLKRSESLRRPVCDGQTLNVLSVTPVRGYSSVDGFRMPASKASLVARESPLSSVLRQRAIATILRNRGRALSSAAKGVPAPLLEPSGNCPKTVRQYSRNQRADCTSWTLGTEFE